MSAYQPAADPTAVIGKRVLAFLIDFAIWMGLYLIVFFLLADSADRDFATCSGTCANIGDKVYGVGGGKAAVVWLVYWGYLIVVFGVVEGLKGVTPGKALLGLKTVNEQGEAPGVGKGIVRALFLIVDLMFCFLIGLVTAIATKKHQRVGDMVAKTFVVGKADAGRPIVVAGAAAEPYGTPVGAAAPYGAPAPGAPAPGAPYAPAAPAAPPVSKESPYGGAPPVAEPTTPMAAPAASGTEAQWDPARNAYIQWDAAQGTWLQFDDATQQWTPISQ